MPEMLCIELKKANDVVFQGKIIINLSTKVTNIAETPLTEAGTSADVLQVQVARLDLHNSSASLGAAGSSDLALSRTQSAQCRVYVAHAAESTHTAIPTPQIHRTLSAIVGSEDTGEGSPTSSRSANDIAAPAQTSPICYGKFWCISRNGRHPTQPQFGRRRGPTRSATVRVGAAR